MSAIKHATRLGLVFIRRDPVLFPVVGDLKEKTILELCPRLLNSRLEVLRGRLGHTHKVTISFSVSHIV